LARAEGASRVKSDLSGASILPNSARAEGASRVKSDLSGALTLPIFVFSDFKTSIESSFFL
jgi:hypothetical protein